MIDGVISSLTYHPSSIKIAISATNIVFLFSPHDRIERESEEEKKHMYVYRGLRADPYIYREREKK